MALVTITWADVVAIAPELAAPAVGVATQNAILAAVALEVVNADWGGWANHAAAYLAAHKASLFLRRAGGGVGPVTAMSVGPTSVSYAHPAVGVGALAATVYGQEYERILSLHSDFRILPLSDAGPDPEVAGWF